VSKNTLKPRLSDYWAIPPDQDAEFVYYMEDVLNLYHEPCDKNHPVICFDESSKILRAISATRSSSAGSGSHVLTDSHYKRNDKQKLHLTTEPLTGWVTVDITDRRRTKEWIDRMVELADDHYPDALDIRVVADHLNTHNPSDFYQFFPPDKAQAYLDRFEFHYVQARQLVEHSRDRTWRPQTSVT